MICEETAVDNAYKTQRDAYWDLQSRGDEVSDVAAVEVGPLYLSRVRIRPVNRVRSLSALRGHLFPEVLRNDQKVRKPNLGIVVEIVLSVITGVTLTQADLCGELHEIAKADRPVAVEVRNRRGTDPAVADCDAVSHAATPMPTGAAVIFRQMAA